MNRVLNEIRKSHEYKDITKEYLHNHINEFMLENLITNKNNCDENLYKIKKDIKKNNEFNKAQFV